MGILSEREYRYAKNVNGNRKSTRNNGNGIAAFSCVPKFPSVDSMRMQSNKML